MNTSRSFRILTQLFQLSSRTRSTSAPCSNVHLYVANSELTLKRSNYGDRLITRWRRPCVMIPARTMAGHNKWSNIKHIKAAKDGEKAKIITVITRKIKIAIKENPNPDPKLNSALARLIAEAKSKNVPSSNIDSAIEQALKSRNAASIVFYEGRGPGGSYFIVEASTDKAIKTKNELQALIKKQGATIGEQGTAKHAFDKKGVIEVCVPEGESDVEKFVDMAIEAGAEEVTMETDEDDEKYLKFVCEADDLYSVKKELEARSLELRSFSVEFLPNALVSPSPKDMELIGKFMGKLDDFSDVLRVFINVEAPSS